MGCWSALDLMVLTKHQQCKCISTEPDCGEVVLAGHNCIFGCQRLIRDWLGQPEADVEELGKQNLHKNRHLYIGETGSLCRSVSRKGRRACFLCVHVDLTPYLDFCMLGIWDLDVT